jgi:hypothetical protein
MNLKNCKKEGNKNNLLAIDSGNQVEIRSDVDENIFYTFVKKEVNLSSLRHQEEKEMTKLLHINIQVNKTKIDAMFESGSHANIIAENLVSNLGLEVQYNHPSPYPLGWVNKDVDIKVKKQCKIKFIISVFFYEVELDVVPLDVCGILFGILYMYMRDAIFI